MQEKDITSYLVEIDSNWRMKTVLSGLAVEKLQSIGRQMGGYSDEHLVRSLCQHFCRFLESFGGSTWFTRNSVHAFDGLLFGKINEEMLPEHVFTFFARWHTVDGSTMITICIEHEAMVMTNYYVKKVIEEARIISSAIGGAT